MLFSVKRWSVPCPLSFLVHSSRGDEEADWRTQIIKQLNEGDLTALPYFKRYAMIQGVLYFVCPNEILARCVSMREAEERLKAAHKQWCGQEGPSLYRRIQRAGYYWPTMCQDAAHMQMACSKCSEPPDVNECLFVGSTRIGADLT